MLMEPTDEKRGNNACTIIISFDCLSPTTILWKQLELVISWEVFYILWKQKDRNGLGENPSMH